MTLLRLLQNDVLSLSLSLSLSLLHVSPFKRKIRVRCPELAPTYHSSFHCIYPSYSSSSDVKWRSRVSELYSRHVKEPGWLWWKSMSLCIWCMSLLSYPCTHDTCVNIMIWIAYIVLKSRTTHDAPPPPPQKGLVTVSVLNGWVVRVDNFNILWTVNFDRTVCVAFYTLIKQIFNT